MTRKRSLTPAMLQILVALAAGPKHGYGIMVELDRLIGRAGLGPATLYRSIRQLLDAGMIEESDGPGEPEEDERRRYYRLTGAGRERATEELEHLEALVGTARRTGLLGEVQT